MANPVIGVPVALANQAPQVATSITEVIKAALIAAGVPPQLALPVAIAGTVVAAVAVCRSNGLSYFLDGLLRRIGSFIDWLLRKADDVAAGLGKALGRLIAALGSFVAGLLEGVGVHVDSAKRYLLLSLIAYVVLKLYIQR